MRKLSLLLLALMVVSGAAFAQVSIEPTIEVEASATFGIQLDEMTTGISNAAEATLSFVFTEEQTSEFGEGAVYGWIELEDFKVEFDSSGDDETDEGAFDVSVGSVTGKVFFGNAYLSLDEATVAANEAKAFALIDQQIVPYFNNPGYPGTPPTELAGSADIGTKHTPEFPGVAIGVEVPDVATVEFGIASNFDWAQTAPAYVTREEYEAAVATIANPNATAAQIARATAVRNAYLAGTKVAASPNTNDHNAYVMSIDAEITAVDMVTIAVVSTMAFGNPWDDADGEQQAGTPGTQGNPAGVGLSVQYDMPMGDMTFSPVVGFDLTTVQDVAEDQEMNMEFGIGAKLSWAALGLDEDEDDHIDFIGDPADDDEEEVTSGAYLGVVYGIHSADLLTAADVDEKVNTMGVRFGLYEDSGDDGILPVVGGALMVEYMSMLANEDAGAAYAETRSDLGIGAELNADLGVVSPYFGIKVVMQDVEGKTLTNFETGDTETRGITTINVGTDINVISNTTFTIDYASGNLAYNDEYYSGADPTYGPTYGNITSSTSKLGVVTVKTKVEF